MIETKNRVLASAFVLMSTGVLFGACGGTDGSSLINGSPGDASTDGTTQASDGSTSGGDGSTPTNDGGGDITDGGANFGDASGSDGGDFPDGGSCNRTDMGPSIMSNCSPILPLLNGGQPQNGTYILTKVTDLGSLAFCTNTFAAVPFEGGLVVSSGVDGAYDLELALDGDMTGRKSFSWSATPAKGNKSPLAIDQTCPSDSSFSLPYNVVAGSAVAKDAIEIEAPYGSAGAVALYHFEKN
jgi:hypothetical protein